MTKLRWRYGIIAGIFLAVFACYPQLKLWYVAGDQWNGHYAYNDIDEVAYAGYLNALISGRPRKNDPYTGRDHSTETPQPESLFSVQFAAPYTIAIPARVLGISAPSAMTLSGALAGFLAAIGCFWIIGLVTGDSVIAMTGSLVALCGGALAAGEGAIGEILGNGVAYPYFPFLRRYVPAVPFPVFFLLLGSVWRLTESESPKRLVFWLLISFISFSFLVFSYFYIWTAAAAWLAVLAMLWLLLRPPGWLKGSQGLLALGVLSLAPLVLYAYMLSNRPQSMDDVLLLVFSRELDLMRFPVYISAVVLVSILAAVLTGTIKVRDRSTIFAISFALVPIIIFNQQVITGRSLQPIHYQVFIGNYVAALALAVSIGLIWKGLNIKNRTLTNSMALIISLGAVIWGFVECHYTVRVLDRANKIRDEGMPLGAKLVELEEGNPRRFQATIFSIGTLQSDDSPTIAPQNVLWSRHQHVFAGLSWEESKERYYRYLYYQNLDHKWLENRLRTGDFISMISLFGWARHSDRLSVNAKPLSISEIKNEAERYKKYIEEFDETEAYQPLISYVVKRNDWRSDFTNLDKWYQREPEEIIGIYSLYRVKPIKPLMTKIKDRR